MSHKLPDKPSDLIEHALADLEAIEQLNEYVVHMDHWHLYDRVRNKCTVCLAGAVLSMTLKLPLTSAYKLSDFDDDTNNKLLALERIRRGGVVGMLSSIGIKKPVDLREVLHVTPYKQDKKEFKQDLRAAVATLRKHGL